MILTALYEYARREELLESLDYERRPVAYQLRFGPKGGFIGLDPCFILDDKGKPRPTPMLVPRGEKRTSGIAPYFLCDKTDYVFAWPDPDPKKETKQKRLDEQHHAFVKLHEEAYQETGDEGLGALLAFFSRLDNGDVTLTPPEDRPAGANVVFVYDPDEARRLHDRPAIREYWENQRSAVTDGETLTCLITGKQAVPEAVHPAVKGLAGANPAGCGLVSFNFDAACSFGKKQNHNAPVSREAAEGYTVALNRLLDRNGQNVYLDASTVAVFWTREADSLEALMSGCMDDDPEAVARLFSSPQTGVVSSLTDNEANRFYTLTLSGAQGRAAVRDWFECSTGEILKAMRAWFEDLALDFPFENPPRRSLSWLLAATVLEGKKDNIPPNMSSRSYAAILRDAPLPYSLLSMAVGRCRAEGVVPPRKQGGFDWNRAYLRASLIKAWLRRAKRQGLSSTLPEVNPMLDTENMNPAYRLGRLFAVLEKMQQAAISGTKKKDKGDSTDAAQLERKINATIADRYYGAASANPVFVFPHLITMSVHHGSKIRKEIPKFYTHYEKLKQEIMDGLPAERFPSSFSLEEQGLFAIGYYHQRSDLFRAKEKKGADDSEDNTLGDDDMN